MGPHLRLTTIAPWTGHPSMTVRMVRARFRRIGGPAGLVAPLVLSACSLGQTANQPEHTAALVTGEQTTIVVTMDIWADIVSNVACEGGTAESGSASEAGIQIETLIPAGADPHGFEASLADRTNLSQASLIISNGLGLEESLAHTVESAEADGVPVLRIGEHLDLANDGHDDETDETDEADSSDQTTDADHADDSDHAGHHHEGADPHIWLDPVLVSAAVPEIAEHLITHAGLDAEAIRHCAQAYQHELDQINQRVSQSLTKIPIGQRNLVTNHDSLGYFAARYDLTVIGTVIPSSSSLAEANPATIEKLAELITTTNTPAIFSDAQQANQEAVALGERLNVAVIPLQTSSLGPASSGSSTYLGWLQTLADQIADALTQ